MSKPEATYEEIMARVAEVTWTMPEERPDHHALAERDEVLDDNLRKAACYVWIGMQGFDENMDLDPPAEWLRREVAHLRDMLEYPDDVASAYERLGEYALRLLGISQSWKSSSARVERGR